VLDIDMVVVANIDFLMSYNFQGTMAAVRAPVERTERRPLNAHAVP